MATATPMKTFDHAGTQRTVRHPLALVRRYIRRYIVLEGAALTLLFASIVFWIGLGIDYGLYRFEIPIANIWGVDWLMELNDIDTTGGSSLGIRLILMGALVIGLLVLAF